MTTVTKTRPRICEDPQHDDRWCPTCEAMWDGIYIYLDVMEPTDDHPVRLAHFVKTFKRAAHDKEAEDS